MRGFNGDTTALETISAAATAIASAENRVPHASASVQKRRWGSWWNTYWCFGSHKHRKRISRALLVPEPSGHGTDLPASENYTQPPTILLPFLAPPSSPASFFQSEPPSATQSPVGLLSISVSANMYSPGGPTSIFAIGPYANETQLVSPPAFSNFTTEPSTAPFTPPPESVHLTTPSSPEVPFAQLLEPKHHHNTEPGQRFSSSHYEFPLYQLYPGSPVGNLISPSSVISNSGTSSPFPDLDFASRGSHILEFRMGDPPKLLNLDILSKHEWGSRLGSGSLTPDAVGPTTRDTTTGGVVDHRVSFELNAENGIRCMDKKPPALCKAVTASLQNSGCECRVAETPDGTPEKAQSEEEVGRYHQKHRSITLGSTKDFNFDNADGGESDKPNVRANWWANEKVVGIEDGSTKNWTFFPTIQPGVS